MRLWLTFTLLRTGSRLLRLVSRILRLPIQTTSGRCRRRSAQVLRPRSPSQRKPRPNSTPASSHRRLGIQLHPTQSLRRKKSPPSSRITRNLSRIKLSHGLARVRKLDLLSVSRYSLSVFDSELTASGHRGRSFVSDAVGFSSSRPESAGAFFSSGILISKTVKLNSTRFYSSYWVLHNWP